MPEAYLEPWLRGPVPGVDPVVGALLNSFQHAREDLARWTVGVTGEQLWSSPYGLASLGFELRHIAASIDRLMTYAFGGQLDAAQLALLKREPEPGENLASLMAALEASLNKAAALALTVNPAEFGGLRFIGRKRLPVPLAGLLIHIAEHTQRHTGQAVLIAKLLRS